MVTGIEEVRKEEEERQQEKNLNLVIAATDNDLEEMNRLLTEGASVDSKNKRGEPALHRAVIAGNAEAVELLLKKGANKEATDDRGKTRGVANFV
jgi:ankyrin repeat protein